MHSVVYFIEATTEYLRATLPSAETYPVRVSTKMERERENQVHMYR